MSRQQESKSIIDKLISIQSSLPKKQEKLCSYILEHYKEIGLLTVKELADRAGVGTTTVMRLIKALGYDSFFELKKEFHQIQVNQSNKWLNVQKSFVSDDSNSNTPLSVGGQQGIDLIEKSITPQLIENFSLAMDMIDSATRINLLGLRTYKGIAIYMESLLIEFHPNVQQLSHDSEAMIDRILQCEQDEVLIIFAFSNYLQGTIDAANVAKERDIPIVLITDQLSCPVSEYADVILRLDLSGKYFTVIPIITLIEAIVVELGKRTSDTSVPKIQDLFSILKEKGIILD
ncbi:MurR/RpiR family transcriptional regulator [Virgibacillus sediminis]|uniref:MurR/RpiR family transcriptional regulator n=1 Tax=Virgibacillus sediminis TaxID=202260 RepID=A0ABV7A3K7_9BACI